MFEEFIRTVRKTADYLEKKKLYYKLTLNDNNFSALGEIIHVSNYNNGNAGDILLPFAVRDQVEMLLKKKIKWRQFHTTNIIDNKRIELINRSKGVIVGGGGLFLKDTNPNNLSGWQWSCPIDKLDKIKVPLVMLAVGYNRFRSQDEFSNVFKDHINLLCEKSVFVGLRNTGSIEKLKEYVEERFHSKIIYHPCPTTLINRIYQGRVPVENNDKFISVNCAFDRSHLRYGQDIGKKLSKIAKALKKISEEIKIIYYVHHSTDEYFLPFMDCEGIKYGIKYLNHSSPMEIIREYSKPFLSIGMRGHSQMIPFGCGVPILSISSHDKMDWFLKDINHIEWGCNVGDPFLDEKILSIFNSINENHANIRKEIDSLQEDLHKISEKNLKQLTKIYGE